MKLIFLLLIVITMMVAHQHHHHHHHHHPRAQIKEIGDLQPIKAHPVVLKVPRGQRRCEFGDMRFTGCFCCGIFDEGDDGACQIDLFVVCEEPEAAIRKMVNYAVDEALIE